MPEPSTFIKILDKLLEIIKDKVSKKQIVAVVTLFLLYFLKAPPMYLAGVFGYATTAQSVLDYLKLIKEKPNEAKDDNTDNMPDDGQ
jgi:hypothetical protein